jgi:hypothetical protein
MCPRPHQLRPPTTEPMKIRIGNLEVSDVTLDELDQLVQRYGGGNPTPMAGPQQAQAGEEPPLLGILGSHHPNSGMGGTGPTPAVAVIGGQKMTAKDVKALRERLAKPSPLPGIDNG